MIYSEDINKVCGLCVYAQAITNCENEMHCTLYKKNMPINNGECKKFKYDIFKKPVRRKRRLRTDFSSDDFSLQ